MNIECLEPAPAAQAPPKKPLRRARFMRILARDMRKKPTNLTISDEIRLRASHLMQRRGFSSFSSFVEQLIRESWERHLTPAHPANSAAPVAAQILSDAVSAAAATPAPAPVTYGLPAKPARPTKSRSAPSRRKK